MPNSYPRLAFANMLVASRCLEHLFDLREGDPIDDLGRYSLVKPKEGTNSTHVAGRAFCSQQFSLSAGFLDAHFI